MPHVDIYSCSNLLLCLRIGFRVGVSVGFKIITGVGVRIMARFTIADTAVWDLPRLCGCDNWTS